MGDLYDMFSQTRFARTHNLMTPRQEADRGRALAEEFWRLVKAAAPRARRIQLKGNHDDRPYKRMMEKTPEMEHFFSLKEFFEFDGVETHHDSGSELHIDGILYTHGHYSKLGAHMLYYLKRVVRAHDHTGGVVFANIHNKVLWELSAGFGADKKAKPLRYSATKTVKWTYGYAVVDKHGPRFCPLE
jgi:hypothetical protein